MINAEPPRTGYDVNFRLFGFPVRIHPLFWLIAVLIGARGGGEGYDPAVSLLAWVAVMFVSILVHELGHALTMRYYGDGARIVLHAFGGLAIPESAGLWGSQSRGRRSPVTDMIISFAGPAAGFLLAGLIVALIFASGGKFELIPDFPIFWDYRLGNQFAGNRNLDLLVWFLLQVNILWGLINLLPVFPLDGGQICRSWLTMRDGYQGEIKALWISVYTGAGMACVGIYQFFQNHYGLFIALLFGSLAYSSYMAIQQHRGGGFGGGFGGGRPW